MKRQDIGFAATLILFLLLSSIYIVCILFAIVHGALYLQR